MKLNADLMTAAALTAATLLASGTLLAANGPATELTHGQITREAAADHPGSTVEQAMHVHQGKHDYWRIVLKERNGKRDELRLDGKTGEPAG